MKKVNTTIIAICLIFTLVLAGCALSDEILKFSGNSEDTPPATGSIDPLDGIAWVLISLNESSPLANTTITAQFAEGMVSGTAGCNGYSGDYTTGSPLSITIPEIVMTERGCLEPEGIMAQEIAYHDALLNTTAYRLNSDQLELLDVFGNPVLTYTRRK